METPSIGDVVLIRYAESEEGDPSCWVVGRVRTMTENGWEEQNTSRPGDPVVFAAEVIVWGGSDEDGVWDEAHVRQSHIEEGTTWEILR